MKKSIVLCADDYGQAPAISQGIIHLLQQERLSAVSCMVNMDDWPEHAKWLLPFQQKMDIGLHFNLTLGKPLSAEYRKRHGGQFSSLGKVLCLACLHSFSQAAIEAELHAQIDRFQEQLGFLPSHLDGHQHIHQFPVIREAIVRVHEERLRAGNAYVRLISGRLVPRDFIQHFKKVVVHAAGSAAMKKLLVARNIPHNPSFAGIYAFGLAANYPAFFSQFLQALGENGLIMCHPGLLERQARDSIARARYEEYRYLAGEQFIEACRAGGVAIKRFNCSNNLL